MKYIKSLTIILGVAALSSCIKHEVIPKPSYEATLPVSFEGDVEGARLEIIKDFEGYSLQATQAKEILPSPQPSSITYYSTLKSGSVQDMVEIRLGKLLFSGGQGQTPTVDEFNEFFTDDITMPIQYKTDADDGVEIVYRDSQGIVYTSSETAVDPQDFEITDLVSDQDENGEYMKFVARFNLSLYSNVDPLLADTVQMENAVFVGYFKRQ
ncbi:hypothetical protein [Brumimicrobium mesophilum]|uniref:hypothetical protein n=1 Tax=Brumimicrobium mesophilum TaxID=392717 RepID=UPI000D13F865|nr:hypothetical protein [Brumimicrobium mesophilum]